MIEQVNGRYINRYAELDKPFTVKGTHSYTSKTTGVVYESMILTQDGADFNFSVADTEIGAMKNFIGKDIYVSCVYNPFGKYSFQQLYIQSFEPIPVNTK